MTEPKKEKLEELLKSGYEPTGKFYSVMAGLNKGKKYPVYAQKGDIAALVYNEDDDKVEMVYRLHFPFEGTPQEKRQEEREKRVQN